MGMPAWVDGVQAAVDTGDWAGALRLLDGQVAAEAAGEATEPIEVRAVALELRAQAAYGSGAFEAAVTAWEDQHTVLVEAGDRPGAARAAAMIALYLMMDTGLMAPVRGWLRRAERLLDGIEEGPAHAVIALVRTYERFMCGDLDAAGEQAASAIALGERFDVLPAAVIGRVASARVTILAGNLDEGLELLDDVGALLLSGRVDPLTTGMMYCELICAAQGLALYDRARDWTEVMDRWRGGVAFGGINGRCRVHRAELLRISGPGEAAEREALAACDELRPWMRREFGWPLVELGNIRLCRGDLEGAAEAYAEANEHVWTPHPGLALLRLAEGDVDGASALIADAIAHPVNIPSKERPPFSDLTLAPLLEAQAEIAAAAGDGATARQAAEALEVIAGNYPSPWLAAGAALAQARTALVAGEPDRAVLSSTEAIAAWVDIGAPFQTARARMVLGEAHHQRGNHRAAAEEWKAARLGFEAFGAESWAAQAAARVAGAAPASPVTPSGTGRAAVFRCDGDTRTISFAGETVVLRDLKGFRYLARLVGEPGRELHVLDLVAGERPASTEAPVVTDWSERGFDHRDGLGGLPLLDDAARDAYRRRLADVDEDIEDAVRMNDPGRAELAQADRDYLIAELSRAVGLGGRGRSVGGSAERARTSVTRSLRYALDRLGRHHPSLAAHLDRGVHTGTYCRYEPDPTSPIDWIT